MTVFEQYTTKTGLKQFKPSFDSLEQMDKDREGFCLACANVQSEVEPDACQYVCEACKKPKVYGAAELALMGLAY